MNEHNLIPITKRSESEQREMRQNGGKKSGESRRRKRDAKAIMRELLAMPVTDTEVWDSVAEMGVDSGEIDNRTAMLAVLLKKALLTGDCKTVQAVIGISGEDNDSKRLKLQKRELEIREKQAMGEDEDLSVNITISKADEDGE